MTESPTIEKSPLLTEQLQTIDVPDYSTEEETYLKNLRTRLQHAKTARDTQHIEFDGMDYITYYNQNERLANTYIEPKKNKEDSNFQSGTIRTKLFALLSSVVNLDLGPDISAFDKHGLKEQGLGDAMEDIILKTCELDGDDEKKLMRQYELLKQGTVFVEEIWDERNKKKKTASGKFSGKLDITWKTKLEKAFARPSRNIVPGVNVYLGDITKYSIADQPFIFTVDSMPYEEAKLIFGEWQRWGAVPLKMVSTEVDKVVNWRLLDIQENYVEIIRYQDKWNNEFAVIINGILMTPLEMALPWGYEDYNITQQNLEPIHTKFAYGKSLVFKIRNKVAILDEMMKLAVLKTQKSFMPPYTNISGRVLSNRVLMPGKISHGIPPNTLVPINDKEAQGVSQSEMAMMEKLQESIDYETTSPIFQGQAGSGNPTATEIIELQRQAKQMLGITVFAVSMLEWKLSWLRLYNLLQNWFIAEDTAVNEVKGLLQSKYRQTAVERPVDGEGSGIRMVIPTDTVPNSQSIMQAEDIYSQERGYPVRFIFLKPEEIKNSKLCWQITVRPKEKKTSETEKLLFRAELQDAMLFGPLLNMDYFAERFASVWNENPRKAFKTSADVMQQDQQAQQQAQQQSGQGVVAPNVNLPTPEKALGRQMNQALTTR